MLIMKNYFVVFSYISNKMYYRVKSYSYLRIRHFYLKIVKSFVSFCLSSHDIIGNDTPRAIELYDNYYTLQEISFYGLSLVFTSNVFFRNASSNKTRSLL